MKRAELVTLRNGLVSYQVLLAHRGNAQAEELTHIISYLEENVNILAPEKDEPRTMITPAAPASSETKEALAIRMGTLLGSQIPNTLQWCFIVFGGNDQQMRIATSVAPQTLVHLFKSFIEQTEKTPV